MNPLIFKRKESILSNFVEKELRVHEVEDIFVERARTVA